jgi:hypothetical protein
MNGPRTAVDGAVITVDRGTNGWALNCTVCGYVMSEPDDERYVDEQAAHHEGWHEAEYQRVQAYR